MNSQDLQQGNKAIVEGHLALLGVQFVFGLFPVLGTLAMDPERGIAPFSLAAWRIVGASLILGAVILLTGRDRMPDRGDFWRLLACSFLGIVANQGLYLSGLQLSSATHAGLMICLVPPFTFAIAVLVRQETLYMRRVVGIGISLAAVVPLILGADLSTLGLGGLGNLLMLLNTLCYAAYLVLSKPLRKKYSAVSLLGWNYILALPALPFFLGQGPLLPAAGGDPAIWQSIAFVVLGPTVLAYLLNIFALGRLRASVVAAYIYIQPMITASGAIWILGEEPHISLIFSAAGLFLGIYLVGSQPRSTQQPSDSNPPCNPSKSPNS